MQLYAYYIYVQRQHINLQRKTNMLSRERHSLKAERPYISAEKCEGIQPLSGDFSSSLLCPGVQNNRCFSLTYWQ